MKVNYARKYPYVVVKFLQLPYADIDDYVCVPRSWLRLRRVTELTNRKSIVEVAYPDDEPPSITKMRIVNCDEPSEKWNLYLAIEKFEMRSFEDAYQYIELKVINKARQSDTISNPSKYPEYSNVESRTLTSSKLTGFDFSGNTVIKENCIKEHQNQTSRDVLSSSDELLHRYPYIRRKPEKDKETRVNSPGAASRSKEKTFYASKFSPTLQTLEKICDHTLELEDNQQLSVYRKHLHHIALTQGIQHSRIPNLRTFTFDFLEPLIHDPDIGSNTSSTIQNPTHGNNQFSQLEISKSSPVIQEHPQVLPNQKTPDYSSEVKCATSEPTAHSQMTSTSHASIACTNSAEHQDLIVEDLVVDELTEASCIEQNVFSGTTAENEFSVNPTTLDEANHSGQTVESSMEEGSPMVEAATSSKISSTQNVDDDEQSNSSDINSDEIITTSPNSHEQAKRSVISVSNEADQLFDVIQQMKIEFSEICQIAHKFYGQLVQTQKEIECMVNASENLLALKKGNVDLVTSKEVTAEVQQTAEVNQVERKEEESPDVSMQKDKKEDIDVDSKSNGNDDDCGGAIKDVKHQDEDNEVPKTTRGCIRTFVLPPEYDPHDTRWTLKYREKDPELNLVELVPRSNVFINSIKLAHCMRSASDSKALARKLLEEIFTQSALSVCSLTGVRANAFDISGTNVRPGLDKIARMAILTFVEKHAVKKKWGAFDLQSVINSLRSKIQDIRAKHAKTT